MESRNYHLALKRGIVPWKITIVVLNAQAGIANQCLCWQHKQKQVLWNMVRTIDCIAVIVWKLLTLMVAETTDLKSNNVDKYLRKLTKCAFVKCFI